MNRRVGSWLLSGCVGMSAVLSACVPRAAAAQQPNIVLIFTDDQGYQDLGCFGSPKIKTPNLDRMASQGMRFTDFYSANSVCSASRASLLTGRYPPRTTITGVLFPRNKNGLPAEEITIAEVLKKQGYATACIGKWHLGHKQEFLPTRQGFDTYYGIPYSNDMWIDPEAPLADDIVLRDGVTVEEIRAGKHKKNKVPLMRDEKVIEFPADQVTLTKRYTDEAIAFIRKNKAKPFFVYLPHTMPHIPIFATEAFKGKSERGLYGDVIEEIDANVGRLLGTLKEMGLDEKTLVIYTSDNGPWNLKNGHGGCALPLRGFKFSTWEGGHRVPCIMRWPGKIPAGTECGEVTGTIDMLPTFAALAGGKVPDDRPIDGLNISTLMFDSKKEPKVAREMLCYWKGRGLQAIRVGDWKLRMNGKKTELFELSKDISEAKNLAAEMPEKTADLKVLLQETEKRILGGR